MAPKRIPMEVRFRQRFTQGAPDECWLWTGWTNRKYGMLSAGGREGASIYAHRFSWELANGKPAPKGMDIAHTCDTPLCVNPAHLFVATRAENMHDMAMKNRSTQGIRHPMAKLTDDQVFEIRRRWRRGNGPALAAEFGVSRRMISLIASGENWKHLMPPSSRAA